MNQQITPPLGVIEGFFGRSWSWQERSDYADFLAEANYHYYIYAPKNDSYLRKHWQQPWPAGSFAELVKLSEIYHARGLEFGVGLSPFEIYLDNSAENRARLFNKLEAINQLQPDILCLLFDDMRGDLPQLADIQIELIHSVANRTTAKKIIFCPTYYSFDPILEKVFGERPKNYWEDLGQKIDPGIDIFWTGSKVCSASYSQPHLEAVTELLQRKPFLWDNYPVNDGAVKSNLLHLRAFDKDHSQLNNFIAGHAVNPMNQAWLSRVPLLSLPRAYARQLDYDPTQAFLDACHQLCEPPLAQALIEDVHLFQDQGLRQISEEKRHELIRKYQQFGSNPYTLEIVDWLNGGYTFDPACLTE